MTIQQALEIQQNFWRFNGNYTEDDFFMFTEASHLLIEETGEAKYMFDLGAEYYERREFDLALKYYELAAENGYAPANLGLGYIWYYGRTGKVDHKKAFEYFSKNCGSYRGDINARYKLADMYKNGYYVEKDLDKYKSIIEGLYEQLRYTNNIQDHLPEVCLRLAGIRKDEGALDEALRLISEGRSMLASRIGFDPFFGNFNIMRSFVELQYQLSEFCISQCDIYDIYHLFEKPCVLYFTFDDIRYKLEAVQEEDGSISLRFGEKWYRSPDDFLRKTKINGNRITLSAWKIRDLEVIYDV